MARLEKIIPLEVYTDGSCKRDFNTSFGAWAYVIVKNSKVITSGVDSVLYTTNQRMELQAIIEGLKTADKIKEKYENVIVYSDSAYVINCYLQEWYVTWEANRWRNASNKEVANVDLWQQLVPYFNTFGYDFRKVKGHADNVFNIRCDEMAQTTAELAKNKWRGYKV